LLSFVYDGDRMTSLRLSFLGDPSISLNGEAIRLKPRKTLALLAYLCLTGQRHSRDALAELLFPRLGRERARAGVRQCLSVLRRSLGVDVIRSDGETVWFDAGEGVWSDVREAMERATTLEALERMEKLFRGDFLSGFFLRDAPGFDSWQRSLEESFRSDHVAILKKLAEIHLGVKELGAAIETARRWSALDSTDEGAHRALMQAYALAGQRAEALREYERCRKILESEVGAAPDAETERLRLRIAQGDFPGTGLRSASAPIPATPPHNLRSPQTAFIGREAELSSVTEAIRGSNLRLLTITGPAGTGKTRLAAEAARRLIDDFPHGVFLVELAPLREPDQVLTTIGAVVGVQDPQGSSFPSFDLVRDYLGDRRLLLVLDNFEHLLAAAEAVARLLADCPRLTVLATSREPLRLQAEHEYLLSPLQLPTQQELSEELSANEAVRLFVDRARATRHDFSLTGDNAGAVARICIRLDGLPLAIELAAGRTRFLPPEKLLSLLEEPGIWPALGRLERHAFEASDPSGSY
jgi:DNA-binding SARP family transcriptional activator